MAVKKWLDKATENLVRLSSGVRDFDEARREWRVNDRVIDNYRPGIGADDLPSCELCLHEKLRWQFEIENAINGKRMLVGSSCVRKFDFPLRSETPSFFSGKIRDGILDSRVREIKKGYVRDRLDALLAAVGPWTGDLGDIRERWLKIGRFSPAEAVSVIAACAGRGISLDGVELSVSLRSLEDRLEVLRLGDDDYESLSSQLDESQRARCAEIRRSRGKRE
jgi:hypothetical protein